MRWNFSRKSASGKSLTQENSPAPTGVDRGPSNVERCEPHRSVRWAAGREDR